MCAVLSLEGCCCAAKVDIEPSVSRYLRPSCRIPYIRTETINGSILECAEILFVSEQE